MFPTYKENMRPGKLKVSLDPDIFFPSSFPLCPKTHSGLCKKIKKEFEKNQFQLLMAILISITLAVSASVSGIQHRAVCYS